MTLPNLTWRALTSDDLPALLTLGQACFLADGGLHFMVEAEEMTNRFLPSDPSASLGAFSPDGSLAACASVRLVKAADVQRILIEGYVLPALRRQGLGTRLMDWSETQAPSLFTVDSPTRQLRVNTESLSEPADRLYRARGYQLADEQLVMRRDHAIPLPEISLPPDVTFTDWDPALADEFFQAYHAAFRERPGFPNWNIDQWVDNWTSDNDHFKPGWSILARAAGEPAAFLMASSDPPDCFVMQVGVVPSQRRRGLASAIITETMRRSLAAGAVSTQLTVATNNPSAIQTYISIGFETIGRRAKYDRPVEQ
jgi:ribosomal protein S18 acetylase RimI-like enzyme